MPAQPSLHLLLTLPAAVPLLQIPSEVGHEMKASLPAELEGLPDLKPEDMAIFGKLMKEVRRGGLDQAHVWTWLVWLCVI